MRLISLNDILVWYQVSTTDCLSECLDKGGLCESYCGLNGYCCRQGWDDCGRSAQAVASSDSYTCVGKGNKPNGINPNNEDYISTVVVVSNGMSNDICNCIDRKINIII